MSATRKHGSFFRRVDTDGSTKTTPKPAVEVKTGEVEQPDCIVYITLNGEVEQEASETDKHINLNYRNIDERFSTNK